MKVRQAIEERASFLQAQLDAFVLHSQASISALTAHIQATRALTGPLEPWLDVDTADVPQFAGFFKHFKADAIKAERKKGELYT